MTREALELWSTQTLGVFVLLRRKSLWRGMGLQPVPFPIPLGMFCLWDETRALSVSGHLQSCSYRAHRAGFPGEPLVHGSGCGIKCQSQLCNRLC